MSPVPSKLKEHYNSKFDEGGKENDANDKDVTLSHPNDNNGLNTSFPVILAESDTLLFSSQRPNLEERNLNDYDTTRDNEEGSTSPAKPFETPAKSKLPLAVSQTPNLTRSTRTSAIKSALKSVSANKNPASQPTTPTPTRSVRIQETNVDQTPLMSPLSSSIAGSAFKNSKMFATSTPRS